MRRTVSDPGHGDSRTVFHLPLPHHPSSERFTESRCRYRVQIKGQEWRRTGAVRPRVHCRPAMRPAVCTHHCRRPAGAKLCTLAARQWPQLHLRKQKVKHHIHTDRIMSPDTTIYNPSPSLGSISCWPCSLGKSLITTTTSV